jgi:hypothetical protein
MASKGKHPIARMRAKATVRKARPKAARSGAQRHVKSSREKVRAYRERMRAKGLRLVQMWVPDTPAPAVATAPAAQSRRAGAAIRKAWAEVLAIKPSEGPVTFDQIAYFAGSVDDLPSDLAANTKKYLRATGYGRKRSR